MVRFRLLLVAIVLIIGLSIAGVFGFEYFQTGKSTPPLTVGVNARLDGNYFQTNRSYLGFQTIKGDIQGDEPAVAVGSNGAIYVAWIGLAYFKNESGDFETQIFFSESTDGGVSFSNPVPVSNISAPLSYYAFDPSVAVTPNGTVFVSYLAEPTSGSAKDSVMLAQAHIPSSGNRTVVFSSTIVASGGSYDRDWITISHNGVIYAVWHSGGQVLLASSSANNLDFSQPRSLLFYARGFGSPFLAFPTGIATDANGTVYIPILAENVSESTASVVAADPLYNILLAKIPNGSGQTESYNVATISSPFAEVYLLSEMFHPNPAIAVSPAGSVYIAYPSDNGSALSLSERPAGSVNFSAPIVLLRANSSLIQMPWVALSSNSNQLLLAWTQNSTGFWNTYTTVFFPTNSTIDEPVKVSSENGYASSVLNWHGDFLGASFVSTDKILVVWSDGRGVSETYGYGHVYATIVSEK